VLKVIRRNAEAAWVKIMFVAIVVVFVFWGIGSVVGGPQAQVVARVNDQIIDPDEYARTYNNLVRTYEEVYKDNFKPELLQGLDLKTRAMDQLINSVLLRQEAQRLGLRVGEGELRDAIAAVPVFQQGGRFNKELYVRVLRANGLSPGEFEDAERDDLLTRKLTELIAAGVQVGEADVRDRFHFDNEKVNLRFIKFDAASFIPEVTLTDADVQAYYDGHQGAFREPDRVRIEYVLYAPESYRDKVEITDTLVQQYYDSHQATYAKPEQVHARHILFRVAPDAAPDAKAQARQRAEEVLKKVKAGDDFAELAKQYSQDGSAASGGDLGFFTRGKMVPPFEQAAFALAPGATSEIVESPFGFHIIKVEAKEEARTQPLDEVRAQIQEQLRQETSRDLARAAADAAHGKATGGATLASIAEGDGARHETPAPFAETESLAGVGRGPLVTAAFTTDAGEVGPVVDAPQGFFVFRLAEKIPAHVPPLPDIRERVESALRNERAEALAKAKAEATLPEAQKSGIEAAAHAAGRIIEETGPFTRTGPYVPGIGSSADVKQEAFKLAPDKAVGSAVYTISGSSYIVALKERIPADDADFAKQKEQLLRVAEQQKKQQVQEEFLNYLKARASVDVSQDFLASVTDTGQPIESGSRRRRR
jgi:peptidyl-prolyl cis-trans isomerase D